jgi:flagellar export protein FliJ
MPPKFSLQSVLDVRHSKVEALEIELSELLLHRQEAKNLLESVKSWRVDLFDQLNQQMQGEMDLFQANHLRADINSASEQIVKIQSILSDLEVKIVNKRQEVVSAKQAEEVLGILKEKEIERYRAEQVKIEGHAQDDIYISQAYRARQQRI